MNSNPWLKSYDPGVPPTVAYDGKLIPSLLEETAASHPKTVAFSFFGYTMTYDELRLAVEQCTRAFSALGLGKGGHEQVQQGQDDGEVEQERQEYRHPHALALFGDQYLDHLVDGPQGNQKQQGGCVGQKGKGER